MEPVPVKSDEGPGQKEQHKEPGTDMFAKYAGFLPEAGSMLKANMTVEEAKAICKSLPGCRGFSLHGSKTDGSHVIHFSNLWELRTVDSMVWTSYKYEAPFTKHDGFLPAGGDLVIMDGTVAEAKVEALEIPGCCGFTFAGADDDGVYRIYFKNSWSLTKAEGAVWTSYRYVGPPILERPAGVPVTVHPVHPAESVITVEKIIEVPILRIVERLVEVSPDEFERSQEALKNAPPKTQIYPTAAILDSHLAVPADSANSFYHPAEAYLGESTSEALRFFRENGFLLLPRAVPPHLLDAARAAVDRDGGRDIDAEEVLAALRDSGIWDVVKMLVEEPQFPSKCQVAKVERCCPEGIDLEPTKRNWFPLDMHIDGLPSVATTDIMNFTVLVGIPLDDNSENFTGNFGVFPGSHQRIAESIQKEGLDALRRKDWFEPLKRMSGAHTNACLPLRVVPGQAYIAHYQTVHFAMLNLCGADPRRVMYFRIWNKRGDGGGHYMKADVSLLSNIWHEFPAVQRA